MVRLKYVLAFCLIAFSIGVWTGINYSKSKDHTEKNSDVLLKQIKEVFKIVNIEGNFSELFHEKSYQWFDLSPFRKSAIIRANARVMVGYDLDSSNINVDHSSRSITIRSQSEPTIIGTEIDLDYYDLQQGTFNQFSPQELNLMQDRVKDIILRKTESSELMSQAKKRYLEFLQIVSQYCKNSGWTLIVLDQNSGNYIMK